MTIILYHFQHLNVAVMLTLTFCVHREKMAFFTTVNVSVPVVPHETAVDREERAGEEFFNDDRIGEEV